MFHMDSNISGSAIFEVLNGSFYRFLRLCSSNCKLNQSSEQKRLLFKVTIISTQGVWLTQEAFCFMFLALKSSVRLFQKPMLSLKDCALKFLSCVCVHACLSPLPLSVLGFFFVFVFLCSSFFLVSFVFSNSFTFVDLASVMTESSHYCQSCHRNSVFWLMYDHDLHWLPEADKVNGKLLWQLLPTINVESLSMCMTVSVVKLLLGSFLFYSLFLSFGFLLFPVY